MREIDETKQMKNSRKEAVEIQIKSDKCEAALEFISKEIWVDRRTDGLSVRQKEREMRVGKLKWMRQALKRIGHGVAVGQGRFVCRLRSQSGSNTAGSLSAHRLTSSAVCQPVRASHSRTISDNT